MEEINSLKMTKQSILYDMSQWKPKPKPIARFVLEPDWNLEDIKKCLQLEEGDDFYATPDVPAIDCESNLDLILTIVHVDTQRFFTFKNALKDEIHFKPNGYIVEVEKDFFYKRVPLQSFEKEENDNSRGHKKMASAGASRWSTAFPP